MDLKTWPDQGHNRSVTTVITDHLPAGLTELFSGGELETKEGETFVLVTVSEDGWPHVALLSVGEVFASSPREIRLALWPTSTTTRNLRRSGRATLAAVWRGTAYYVELDARPRERAPAAHGSLAHFSASIRRVLADAVDYADLTTGIRFVLKDKAAVVKRWEETIRTLRAW